MRDRAVMDEIRERLESDGSLPRAADWSIPGATLRAVVGGKAPKAGELKTRPYTEAIVLLHGRPALLVRNDTFEIPKSGEWRNRLLPNRSKLERALRAVGRVEVRNHPDLEWVGTAWVLAERILVTNRHVALEFAQKKGKKFVFKENPDRKAIGVTVDFKEEFRTPQSLEIEVEQVLFIEETGDRHPDLALLRLKEHGALPAPIPIAAPDAGSGNPVAVVGYPARDSRNDSDAMAKVFGDIYNVKRLAPGTIAGALKADWFFTHDCSTLGGNSGSVVLDIETGMALGLHFGGRFKQTNYAVKASILRDRATRFRLQLPTGRVAAAREAAAEKTELRRSADYADRVGYEPDFFGPLAKHRVPLPTVKRTADVVPVKGKSGTGKGVLPYTHFSVVMSKARRLPYFTAVNISGEELRNIPRKGDRWYLDPRIPTRYQVGNELYLDNDFDRGHMVRRLDPVWGSPSTARVANDDTFHFTNACPQHKDLNQKTWNDLEEYILGNAGARNLQVSVFTGPVFRDDDPAYREVALPREFWKVAALVDEDTDEIAATGYLLSQSDMIADLEFAFGRFRTYQVPIRRIETLTGLDFGTLATRDPLAKESLTESLGTGAASREVRGPADIRFR